MGRGPGRLARRNVHAFVAKSPRAEVVVGEILDETVNNLLMSIAGDVIKSIEGIVKEVRDNAYDHWYDDVRKVTGASQKGMKYKVAIRGDNIVGVVFNDAVKPAWRANKSGVGGAMTDEKYGYFVHRPRAFSTIARPIPLPEYRALMSFYRKNGTLPPGYTAKAFKDSKGRNRPVGIAKIELNPKASDGKRLWNVFVTQGSKPIVKKGLVDLDKALQATAKRITK